MNFEFLFNRNFYLKIHQLFFAQNLSVITGLITGLLIATPELIKDAQFRSAIKFGNGDKIIALSTEWPQSMDRINLTAGQVTTVGNAVVNVTGSRLNIRTGSVNITAWAEVVTGANNTWNPVDLAA